MSEGRQCSHCNAPVRSGSARFCEYCGAELPVLAPSPTAPGGLGPADVAARLAALDGSSDLPRLMRHTPSTTSHSAGMLVGVGVLVVFTVVALVMLVLFRSVADGIGFPGSGVLTLVPVLIVAVGAFLLFKLVQRTRGFLKAPLERLRAAVVDERTEVRGGGDSGARTHHYVTLELADGTRRECLDVGRVAGEVTRGDVGIAYVKGEYLLDYARVVV